MKIWTYIFTRLKMFGVQVAAFLVRLFSKRGEIHYIGGSEALPPSLSPPEEQELLALLEMGDEGVKPTLIERNLRLVVYIARKFENTGISIEDLISIGTIGLIKAVNTFDVTKKIKLATYASRCIENEILMYLRRNGKTRYEVSLDEPLNTDWDGNELLLSDIMGTDGDLIFKSIEKEIDREMLQCAMENLTAREKKIMVLRFGLDNGIEKTQKQVADLLGISQSYISRLEKRIILHLKREISKMA
jgi:RNA polymerase sporulation-specific sigma factor